MARLILMVIGTAVATLCAVLVGTLPFVLHERGDIAGERTPLPAVESGDARFQYQVTEGFWEGARFTRVVVADVAPDAPTPPGVDELPGPGEVVLSPAAVEAQSSDGFDALVDGRRTGVIDPAGLLGPDELYAYVGVPPAQIGQPKDGIDWGGFGPDHEVRGQFAHVPWQLTLIVGAPLLIFLTVCARLSAGTRVRRYAALRLVGASQRLVRQVAGWEYAVVGAVGGGIGLAAFGLVNEHLGRSGAVGFTWYPNVSAISGPAAAAVVVLVTAFAALVGSVGTTRALARPVESRTDPAERPVRWWHVLAYVFGMGVLAYPVIFLRGGSDYSGTVDGLVLIVGTVLATVGLFPALRPLLVGSARWLCRLRAPLTLRMAARRVEHQSGRLARQLAGLCLLVLVAAVGSAVARHVELSASPAGEETTLHLYGGAVPEQARPALRTLPADAVLISQRSITEPSGRDTAPATAEERLRRFGATMVVASCETLRTVTGAALDECQREQWYRLGTSQPDTALPAGTGLRFADDRGGRVEVVAPERTLDVPRHRLLPPADGLLYTGDRAPTGVADDARVFFQLPSDIKSLDRFASQLATLAPAATLQVHSLDLGAIENYRVQRGTIGVAVLVAFVLGFAAFVVSSVADGHERRRQVAHLRVVGAARRTLRSVQWWQLLAPSVVALGLAVLTGHMAGNALLRVDSSQEGWYLGTLSATVPLLAVALLGGVVASAIVIGLKLKPVDLRRE